jgi:manganese/zinc/iron transport system substrate-binding protein
MSKVMTMHAVFDAESAISKFNPTHRDSYQQKAEHYKEKLVILDQHIETLISTIPESAQILLTAHDAFGYFEQGYGIEVIGIQGLSTESEAGLKRVEELVDILVEKKVPAIFAETSVSERNIKALIEGAKARGHDVKLGGFLYSDAMGAKGSPEGTYIGMMDFNVRTITKALGGEISALLPDRVFASAL